MRKEEARTKKNKKRFLVWLLFSLVFFGGAFLLYILGSQFLRVEPPRQVSFEPQEMEGAPPEQGQTFGEAEPTPKEDYEAPDFTLAYVGGESVTLSAYKNTRFVVMFWTTWNPAAQDQLVILESYYKEVKDEEDIAIFVINSQEDKSVVANFIRRGGYQLPVLLDEEGEVGELYNITTIPVFYFIDPQGIVRETHIGVLSQEEIKEKVGMLYQL